VTKERVQVVTLGCSKNRVDSEHLLSQLREAGMIIIPEETDLSLGETDTLIINTCGFIKDAKEESIQAILEGVEAKKQGFLKRLFVWGCLSQRYMPELKEEIPEVDMFLGSYDIKGLLNALGVGYRPGLETTRVLTTPSHYGYLKISEGCDRSCSYCAIPGIRGRHISVPIETLVEEAEKMADGGVRELLVIAQDTTYYGLDIYKSRKLAALLAKLTDISGIEWIRLHYSYPASFPDDVLEIMASSEKICKYMDIPLQHSADSVLSAMRRGVTGAQTRALVKKMRERVPGIALRTTLIVGHPGEGEDEFRDLLRFVEESRFERLGAFTYSEEEGTWGAQHLRDDIPEELKQERYEELMELQSGISLEYNESRIGTIERVLIDSYSETDRIWTGRTSKESPEVDGEVLIRAAGRWPGKAVGTFVNASIVGADEYDLTADLII